MLRACNTGIKNMRSPGNEIGNERLPVCPDGTGGLSTYSSSRHKKIISDLNHLQRCVPLLILTKRIFAVKVGMAHSSPSKILLQT